MCHGRHKTALWRTLDLSSGHSRQRFTAWLAMARLCWLRLSVLDDIQLNRIDKSLHLDLKRASQLQEMVSLDSCGLGHIALDVSWLSVTNILLFFR